MLNKNKTLSVKSIITKLIFFGILIMTLLIVNQIDAQTNYPTINSEIKNGNFNHAKELINQQLLSEDLPDTEKYNLYFQIDVMNRIEKDFKKTRSDVKEQLSYYFPNLTDEMIDKWEQDKSLEMKVINGEKRYFNNAVPNLFRINKECCRS